MYRAKILADSVSPGGVRLITILTRYPRLIHSEMLRHRVFSHSVASSRAIPTEKQIAMVWRTPFVPETFNRRVKGMGVGDAFSGWRAWLARMVWVAASKLACAFAWLLMKLDVDKSRANRLLEPFAWVDDVITGTEWSNFFALRDNPQAQPEFQKLAKLMRTAIDRHQPSPLMRGAWHLPFIVDDEILSIAGLSWDDWAKISAARIARVSFDRHEQYEPISRSLDRANMLLQSGHYSPFEHVARPLSPEDSSTKADSPIGEVGDPALQYVGNLRGWVQLRKTILHEHDYSLLLADVG